MYFPVECTFAGVKINISNLIINNGTPFELAFKQQPWINSIKCFTKLKQVTHTVMFLLLLCSINYFKA